MLTLTIAQIIIGSVLIAAGAAGITYYLVTLQGNAQLNCDAMYGDISSSLLDPDTAKQMIGGYAASHKDLDTCSVWFSLKSIQAFACNIEKNTKLFCNQSGPKSQPIQSDSLGIRFYFAQANYGSTPPQTTLVLVPTYNKNGVDTDFDPTQAAGGQSVEMCDIYNLSPLPTTIYAMNHGNRVPPPWPVSAGRLASDPTTSDFYTQCGAYFLGNI